MPPPGASENASHGPAGDQDTPPTGSSNAVTCSGHPPAVATVKICGMPVMFETNAMRFPSGEKLGPEQNPTRTIAATDRSRSPVSLGSAAHRAPAAANRIPAYNNLFIRPPGPPSTLNSQRSRASPRQTALLDLDQDRILRVHHFNDRRAHVLRD